jgi:hypothetical protein
MRHALYGLILATFLTGCASDEQEIFSVRGTLAAHGQPPENSTIDIDGLAQYTTTPDAGGDFLIPNVSKGSHTLTARTEFGNGVYSVKSQDIIVNGDVIMDTLLLPNPVSIASVELDSSTNRVTVTWNSSLASDFVEYRLYSHINSGLDEQTGSLEYSTTSVDDTVFSIQAGSLQDMYFRVFVLNAYGQLGGSNIEHMRSQNINLLAGGDFEDAGLFGEHWDVLSGNAVIVDTAAYEGTSCLLLQNAPLSEQEIALSSLEVPFQMETDVEYELSFWYRVRGRAAPEHHQTLYFYYLQKNEKKIETILPYVLGLEYWTGEWINEYCRDLEDSGWLHFSKRFVPDSAAPALFHMGGRIETLMLDNLELKRTEYAF